MVGSARQYLDYYVLFDARTVNAFVGPILTPVSCRVLPTKLREHGFKYRNVEHARGFGSRTCFQNGPRFSIRTSFRISAVTLETVLVRTSYLLARPF
jgi:hypothetical protein